MSFLTSHCFPDPVNIPASDTATILFPGKYYSRYPRNVDAFWRLDTDDGRKILISFTKFKTPAAEGVFRAGDGSDRTNGMGEFFSWSGERAPPALLSSGSKMWLSFESSKASPEGGFSLLASSVPSNGKLRPLARCIPRETAVN